jgi:hypothetical protein
MFKEFCSSTTVPDGPYTLFSDILRVQKEGTQMCRSEWSQSLTHTQKTWTEVSSSVPHFLQVGLLLSPITYKCLLEVLCPVRRPITTQDCVLLKDNNRALVASLGPEINSRAHLCVLQGPCHNTKCWLSIQCFIFLLMFCLERELNIQWYDVIFQKNGNL